MKLEQHQDFEYPVYAKVQTSLKEIGGNGVILKGRILYVKDIVEGENGYTVICEDINVWLGENTNFKDTLEFYDTLDKAGPTLYGSIQEFKEALGKLWEAIKEDLTPLVDYIYDFLYNDNDRWE